jgi:hypothetical protein
LNNGNKLAFELTEAVDERQPHRDDVSVAAEEIWNDHHNKKISDEKRARFDSLFGGCCLSLRLTDHATKSDVKKAIPLILKKYQNSCRDQLGLLRWIQDDLPKGCERLIIEPQSAMPVFRCSRASHVSADFVVKAIKKKFNKPYKTACPIHLLVYNDHHPLGPDCFWMAKAKSYVEANLNRSPFERVWVFDLYEKKIEYVFPAVDG